MKISNSLLIGAAVFAIAAVIVGGWSAMIDLPSPGQIGRPNQLEAGLTIVAALLGGLAALAK